MAGEPHSSLSQFEIKNLLSIRIGENLDLSFTNSALSMALTVSVVLFFFMLAMRKRALVPGRMQCAAEIVYEAVANMLKNTVGEQGKRFFPLIFATFLFVLGCNVMGMFPGAFTSTSHVIVNIALAIGLFITINIFGIAKHGLHFFTLFAPKGIPVWILPLLVPIEVFAYLVRPVSLALRLTANMMAGHITMKVVAGFVAPLGVFGVLPIGFLVLLTGFELFIAALQAYIFTLLLCIYLNDTINLH